MMRILNRAEVEALLVPSELLGALEAALRELSAGRASAPPRIGAATGAGLLAAMVGAVPSANVLAAKLVSVFPGNEGTPLPTHQALVAVFDPATGEPLALLDGAAITAHRTAAVSAIATRLLSRSDARVLAIAGTGVQAASHLRYVSRERDFREVRIGSRDPRRAEEFARRMAASIEVPVVACGSYEEAMRGADVVCAATHADQVAVRGRALAAGAHLNSVGFGGAGLELAADVFAGALVAVESRAAAFAPMPVGANDLRAAADPVSAVELGELLSGSRPGRTSAAQRTVYKSVGIAVEDAVAAALVVARARGENAGREIDL
jgi:ornithine cyclodeaminase/alanine dehydrogenase-like protein (mu-crystallin family)